MEEKKIKKCPFNQGECTPECGLYIDPKDLNEVVRNKLASIGIIKRDEGICSLKNLSMCLNRAIFEDRQVF